MPYIKGLGCYVNVFMKNFAKGINKDGEFFKYLRGKFPLLSEAKVKEGIFVGLQICELITDENFRGVLKGNDKESWDTFKGVVHGFLGNRRAGNYAELVNYLLEKYHQYGCNMSFNIHFLSTHLDFFPDNCSAGNDEHGERFHQDISSMERRYQGAWNATVAQEEEYKRQAKRRCSCE